LSFILDVTFVCCRLHYSVLLLFIIALKFWTLKVLFSIFYLEISNSITFASFYQISYRASFNIVGRKTLFQRPTEFYLGFACDPTVFNLDFLAW
jgi:hypothetical protein